MSSDENIEIRLTVSLGTLRKLFSLMTEKEKINLLTNNFKLLTKRHRLKSNEKKDNNKR